MYTFNTEPVLRRKILPITPEEVERRKEAHRAAQARYRARNRSKLKNQASQYRLAKKREKLIADDEEEYQRLMAQELDDV
ncbi:hypothetical protein CVT26_004468 [Gymnopilus dilepis]|uniref:BZIP domain-containing protein n=1 Tax=Gymnopilus dilepis TaxID=231916 RepID=A0A409WDV1_9AGAR|nr:hypothetical protein CVT26_004468 [Gymnopilus dilepis]